MSNENDMDSSCFIVESKVEVIEINETQNEDEDLDELEKLKEVDRNNSPGKEIASDLSGFLVIDETGNDSILEVSKNKEEVKDPINTSHSSAPKTPKQNDSTNNNNDEDVDRRVLIDIKFNNKKTYFAFHEEFIDVVKKYYRSKIDDINIHDDSINNRLCISEKLVKKSESFLIDTTPKACTDDIETTPKYTSLNTPILSYIKRPFEDGERVSMSSNRCFNCDKDTHSLRDCPEPRNMNKIRKARNEFNRRELRYHDDNDESTNVPGKLSDELKAALGLEGNQIPLHVYKMRLFGYPPGWLEEAKIQHSGLSLFTGNDSSVKENHEVKYDIQKIYEYPGFNVSPDGQFVDKSRLLHVPPMMYEHSKDFFIKSLGDKIVNGYKKRKLCDNIETDGDTTLCDEVEMEIADENDEEVIPLGRTIYQDPPPPGDDTEDGECSSDSDLEKKKELLLNQLAAEDESINKTTRNSIDPILIENSENENRDNYAKDIDIGHVQTTVFGTPVLPSFSSFDSLPDGDKFMEGVSDVIAFENLAESTGKYEHMRELIKKVRNFQKKHQQE